MNELFDADKLLPVVDGAYLLSETANAFRYFGTGLHEGKIVITVSQPDGA